MHGIPKGKRKLINRDNIISQVLIVCMIIAAITISFMKNIQILKVISLVAIGIVGVIIVSFYAIEFFTGAAFGIASVLNEVIYLVIGIPLLVISAGFLPISIYISFFNPDNRIVNIVLIIILVSLEILSILYIFRQYLRERKMNLFQYIRYLFDFKARKEENIKVKERREQIDSFYDDLSKVEDRISKKLEERSSGFDEYDWKSKVQQLNSKKIKTVKCWNCQTSNDKDALFCVSCSAPLKKQT